MRFTATCVTCQTQDDVAMLGFADDEFNTSQYVLLQKDLEPSQEDLELGHDRPYIEIDDQRYSRYGGVVKAQLKENQLVLKLDPQAAADMSVDDTIEISFRVPMERLKEISSQLRLLLGNDIVQVDASI
ncbi:MAG: hypothetical protein KatS3mg105_4670 [Gemmatales bacterium]|nr:MAG: hypothetical protein KatS3mg105_4670 [Gemmatales bacterium]